MKTKSPIAMSLSCASVLLFSALFSTLFSTLVQAEGSLFNQGRMIFTETAQPSCTLCHTLADAGSAGEIGPNLNELQPSKAQVLNAVTGGVGIMPAFVESLSAAEIEALATYVEQATKQAAD